jgi:hypothetical protein
LLTCERADATYAQQLPTLITWSPAHPGLGRPGGRGHYRRLLFELAGPQWLRCAVPFDPLRKRVLERGRDVHTGAVGGLLKPLDQLGAD